MRTTITVLALAAALAAPAIAQTSTTATSGTRSSIASTLNLPDGTYTATVEKVLDSKRVVVKLADGREATLATAKANVDFSKCQTNQQIKFSTINGLVAVYAPANEQ